MYSVGAHVIWPGESNEQPVCAVPPCSAVTISVEDSTHCKRHCDIPFICGSFKWCFLSLNLFSKFFFLQVKKTFDLP